MTDVHRFAHPSPDGYQEWRVLDVSGDGWPEHATLSWQSLAAHVSAVGPLVVVVDGRRLVVCQESTLRGVMPAMADPASLSSSSPLTPPFPPAPVARGAPSNDPWRGLTPRQRQVALLAVEGRRAGQIGLELGIATQTVRVHLNAVRVQYRAETVAQALRSIAAHVSGDEHLRHGA